MIDAKQWLETALTALRSTAADSEACIGFTYGGQPSSELLHLWSLSEESLPSATGTTKQAITRTDPATGLSLRVEITTYADYPVVEWVAHLRNTSSQPTPIVQDIHSLDISLPLEQGMLLNTNKGDYCTPDSYEPLQDKLEARYERIFAPEGGRPTNKAMPYFNLERANNAGGLIVCIGWPGQWTAHFKVAGAALHITGGQELTHFTLMPGETVRTPMSVLLFYTGSRVEGQNLWRRWLLAHNLPRGADGNVHAPMAPMCIGTWHEQAQKDNMDYLYAQGAKYAVWWVDAGWYPCESEGWVSNSNWTHTGDWNPDPKLLPTGFKPISEYAHQYGMKLMVWFEPERVWEGTWLDREHPDWLLHAPPGQTEEWYIKNRLFNLGNPDARAWLTEHVDRMLTEQGIDWYRQDHNFDPLIFWRANDTPDRQGITEIRHVEGYLAYWDELLHRHPGILIDSCASGGRRNDLETLRRAVPLLRSDYQSFQGDSVFAVGNQGHTYGLSAWLPYQGQGVYYSTDQFIYCARSYLCSSFAIALGMPKEEVDWNLYNQMLSEFESVKDAFIGDFYPLTSYSLDERDWMAWQYHRPDLNEGMLQVFRRKDSPFVEAKFKLFGLEPQYDYWVTNLDERHIMSGMSGQQLMQDGITVTMNDAPQAVTIKYSLFATDPE